MAIDTLAYVKELEAAGLDRKVAEAHARALRNHILPELATKQDVKDLGAELRIELWKIALGIVLGTTALVTAVQRLLA
jgi:hypothetical protein